MDIRPRASQLSKGSQNNPDSFIVTSISNSSTTTTTTIREGTNISNRPSRIRPNINCNESDRPEVASANTSSNNIFGRVSNSVSGLFSNVSWSEWLRSPSTSHTEQEREDSSVRRTDALYTHSEASPSSSIGHKSNRSFNQLYPEEGNSDFSGSEERKSLNICESFSDKPFIPMPTSDMSSFKRNLSIISSTPNLTSSSGSRKRGNEEFLCDSIISKPSTSTPTTLPALKRDFVPPHTDSLQLLKQSFPESRGHDSFFHQNGSLNKGPATRKRNRDNSEDESGEEGDKTAKRGRPFPSSSSPLHSFSEPVHDDTLNESQSRKRPRFSVSTYGSPLYRKPAVEEEEEPSFSIFYPGKVMYGGASNHQRKKNRIIPRKVLPRTPVTSTSHADDSSDGGLSSAARRILNCIDKISTPLSDSKRVFPFTSQRDSFLDSSAYVADFHKHRPSLRSNAEVSSPPVNRLLTPSKVKIHKNFSSLLEPKNVTMSSPLTSDAIEKDTSGFKLGKEPMATKSVSAIFVPSIVNNFKRNPISSRPDTTPPSKPFFVPEPQSSLILNSQKKNALPAKDKEFKRMKDNVGMKSFFVETTKDEEKSKKKLNAFITERINNEERSKPVTKVVVKDDMEYKFSDPEVVSDSSMDEFPVSDIEFVFSSPLQETESSAPSKITLKPVENVFNAWGDKFKPMNDFWECEMCLIQNNTSKEKCAACKTPKPKSKPKEVVPSVASQPLTNTSMTFTGGWGDVFKAAKNSWDCNICLLQNKGNASSCVACLTPKPKKETETKKNNTSLVPPPSFNHKFSSNWGDPKGSWDCSMYLLQNKEDESKCAACETPKPNSASSSVAPKSSSVAAPPTTEAFPNSWGEAFKPSKGSWECGVCMVQNDWSASSCLACQSLKPKETSPVGASEPFKDVFKGSVNTSFGTHDNSLTTFQEGKINQDLKDIENSWWCPNCIMMNKATEDKCESCKCAKSDSNRSSRNSSVGGFGSEFFKAKDEWECETCLVRNKNSAQKCVSCATSRNQLSRSTIVSEALTGNFKFGVNSQPSKESSVPSLPTFNPSSSKPLTTIFETAPSQANTTKSDAPKFMFGNPLPVTESKPVQSNCFGNTTTASSSFSFFKSSTESKDVKTTESSISTIPPPSDEAKPKPLFQFSAMPPTDAVTNTSQPKLEFPKIESKATTGFSFQSNKTPAEPLPKVNPSTFSFFGNDSKPAAPAVTPFAPPTLLTLNTNKEPTTTAPPSATPSLTFAFGQPNTKSMSTGFNFGEAASKNSSEFNFGNTPSLFQFGQRQPAPAAVNKPPEPAPPAFLNIETPMANPFNATSSSAGPHRRIKKAYRRNK